MKKINIEYICFLNQSGYGTASQDYLLALNQTNNYNIKLKIFGHKPSRPAISDEKYEIFAEMMNKKEDPDAIVIYHCIPTFQKRFKTNKRSLGFSTFECYEPPSRWLDILNKNDALIVPSLFNYKVFAHANVKKPIYHIPHCFNKKMYNRDVEPLNKFNKYTFLFMGTWKVRKGYKQLIEAWFKEFNEKDNVQLLIKTDKVNKAKRYVEKIREQMKISKGIAPILFESKVFSEKELPSFMKSFDSFILPTAGEGFCIPGLQCMALGIPVIITDYSGCKDYAKEETSTLIKTDGFIMKNDMDGIPQFRNKKWAFVSVKNIRKSMRFVLDNPLVIKEKVDVAHDYVMQNFNYIKIETMFREMLRSIYDI